MEGQGGYTYGLAPTTFVAGRAPGHAGDGKRAILLPSGCGPSPWSGQSLLKTDKALLYDNDLLNPNREFNAQRAAQWGIATAFYDPMDAAAAAITCAPSGCRLGRRLGHARVP